MSATHLMFVVTEDWYFVSHRLALAQAARDAGFKVSVVTRVQEHARDITAAGVNLIDWRHERGRLNPFTALGSLARLMRIYRRERPDIVHHVALEPAVLGGIAARMTGVPHVINAVSGMGWLYASDGALTVALRPIARWMMSRVFAQRSTFAIVQNPDDAKLMQRLGVPAERMHTVAGAGVDMSLYPVTPEPLDAPVMVLFPARVLIDKGVNEFADAVRILRSRGVALRAVLAGAPDPRNRASVSNELLSTWVREGVVEHLGWVRDMPDLFARSHIVCLPSYREGLPKALLEAAAAARPVVTTDVPGCRSTVTDGENGLLVPARDACALADALQRLIESKEMRVRMGVRGRARAEREWSSRVVNAQLLSCFARVAS